MSSNASYMALGLNSNFSPYFDSIVKYNLFPKKNYMNIWIVSGADGSNWVAFGGGGIVCVSAYVFNLHGTVSHELGHEMSLDHTFAGETQNADGTFNCPPVETDAFTQGDKCGDTPRHTEFSQSCNATVQNPCYPGDPTQVDDLYETNYMAYGRCGKGNYGMFSNDQKTRIRVKAEYRSNDYVTFNQLVPPILPVVNFFADNTVSADLNVPISFYEKSDGVPNTNLPDSEWPNIQFEWEFKNGSTIYTSTKQNPVMLFSVPGYYDVTLTITTSLGVSTSTKQQYIFVQSQPITPVCSIDFIEGAYYHSVHSVQFNDIYKETRIDFSDTYLDLRSTNNTIVNAGQTYPLIINVRGETNRFQHIKIYIDYNDNGSFEDTEQVFKGLSTSDFQYFNTNVTIPLSAIRNRLLTMRVIGYSGEGTNNCGRIGDSDVEDYGIVINGNCSSDLIDFSANKIVGYTGSSIQFHDKSCISDQSIVNSLTYNWSFTNGPITYVSNQQHPSITFLELGVYDVTLTITKPSGTQTLVKENFINITNPATTVCSTFTGDVNYFLYRMISKVAFNTINKETSTRTNEGYKDFRNLDYTVVKEGSTYPLSINLGTSGGDQARYKVYIDYNNSGSFDDSELVVNGRSSSSSIVTLRHDITIPFTSIKNRMLTMRVMTSSGDIASACSNISVPDVEDYGILIISDCNEETIDFNADKIIGCSNTVINFIDKSCIPFSTNFSNYSYEWIFSNGTKTYISNSQYPSITFIETGVYSAILNITTPTGLKTVTKERYLKIVEAPKIVCNSITSTDGQNSRNINRVIFNTIDKQTSTSINEGYQDFRCTNTTVVKAGQTYPLTISINSTSIYNLERFKVYIDYNNDGVFSISELIFEGKAVESKIESYTKNIIIPSNLVKNTLLTMRVVGNPEDINATCGSFKNADVEDYGIYIENNSTAEFIDFESDLKIACINSTINFFDNSRIPYSTNFSNYTYLWTFTNGSTTYTSTQNNPSITFLQSGLYNATLSINTPLGVKTLIKENYIRITESPVVVCTISPSSGTWSNRAISKVMFNNISKATPSNINEVYKDFRCTDNTGVISGRTYPLSINIGTEGTETATYKIFIDYNNNALFESTELVFSGTSTSTTVVTLTKNIIIPNDAVKNKLLTMRVMTAVRDFATACSSLTVPDVEDYGIVVLGYTAPPSGDAIQNLCVNNTVANIIVTGSNIKYYANSEWGSALSESTTLVNNKTYYLSQIIDEVESIERLAVTVILPDVTISSSGSTTFCTGGNVLLTSSSISGNQWYDTNGIIIGATSQTYTATTSGNYAVIFTNSNNCSTTSTAIVVTVNPIISPPTISTSGSTTICDGDNVVLTSSTTFGNQWHNLNGVIVGATSQTYTATTSGVYKSVLSASACSSVESTVITVTVNLIPSLPTLSASGSTTFCAGGNVILTSSTATGNQWYNASGIIVGATSQTYTVTNTGAYSVRFTNTSNCSATSAATAVTVNPLPSVPTISASGSTIFCAGGNVVLTSTTASGNQWHDANGIIIGATSQTYSVTTSGNYTVQVINSNGCLAISAATVVTVNPIPSVPAISASGSTIFCTGGNVVLTSSSATGNQWYNASGIIVGATSQTYTATNTGAYTVRFTNTSNCSATSTSISVLVNDLPTISGLSIVKVGSTITLIGSGTAASENAWASSNDNVTISSTGVLQGIKAGTSTITFTNISGCQRSFGVTIENTFVITSIDPPVITFIKPGNKVDTVYWSQNDTLNLNYFKIFRGLSPSSIILIDSISKNSRVYIDTSKLILGTKYYYKVIAGNTSKLESNFSNIIAVIPFNMFPIAVKLPIKTFANSGEISNKYASFSSEGSKDIDGKIIEQEWYLNDKLFNKNLSLEYYFPQGSTKVKLLVIDNDGSKDSSETFVHITSFQKTFNGGILGGITALSPNAIFTADTSFDSVGGASITRLDKSGKTSMQLFVGSKILTTPSVSTDSSIFITSGSSLNGFDKYGISLWPTITLGGLTKVTPTIDSFLNRIYLGVTNNNFFALDYKTGKVVWSYLSDAPINTSAIISADRKLIFTSQFGTLYGFDIINADAPKVPKWKVSIGDIVVKAPAVDAKGYFYLATNGGKLIKLKFNFDGTTIIKWKINLNYSVQSSPVIDADGFIYVGNENGDFYKIDPNTGETLWSYNLGAAIRSSPAISEYGNIYIATMKGDIFSIKANMQLNWIYNDIAPISSNILYLENMIYVGNESGRFTGIYDNPNGSNPNISFLRNNLTSSSIISNKLTSTASNIIPSNNASSFINKKITNTNSDLESTILKRNPVWSTFQGDYRRSGSVTIECPTSLTITRDPSGLLITSIPNYVQWYKDGNLINGLDTIQFKPVVQGNYYTKFSIIGCPTLVSNSYYFTVTDIVNLEKNQFIKLSPNPFIRNIYLDFSLLKYDQLNADIYEFSEAKLVAKRKMIKSGTNLDLAELAAGIYVIRVTTSDFKLSYSFKIIKL